VKRIAILGSTGSIGRSALDVVDAHPDRLAVTALVAGRNAETLAEQVARYRPALAGLADREALAGLEARLASGGPPVHLRSGPEALVEAASHPDVDLVLCASSGTAGLEAALAAIDAGKAIALANKEVLVMAGDLMVRAARARGVAILPVDSEHNAIHQCLHGRDRAEVRRLIVTASGGPFRTYDADRLAGVTPQDALRHPTWRMGRKITIDSATLMNKGFEVIEACRLFDFGPDRVQVVVHPQSIVHALVEYRDGSVIAQLCPADMKMPIRYALSYPDREIGLEDRRLAWDEVRRLDFEPPDFEKFPLLRLAYKAIETGGAAGCVLNAADEVAVEAFLNEEAPFSAIPIIVEKTLERVPLSEVDTIEETLDLDRQARDVARGLAREAAVGA
jgi:1-deoxy-D-xylulose-5-phosphate reductoisomerase